jgi:hypothetical protein
LPIYDTLVVVSGESIKNAMARVRNHWFGIHLDTCKENKKLRDQCGAGIPCKCGFGVNEVEDGTRQIVIDGKSFTVRKEVAELLHSISLERDELKESKAK